MVPAGPSGCTHRASKSWSNGFRPSGVVPLGRARRSESCAARYKSRYKSTFAGGDQDGPRMVPTPPMLSLLLPLAGPLANRWTAGAATVIGRVGSAEEQGRADDWNEHGSPLAYSMDLR